MRRQNILAKHNVLKMFWAFLLLISFIYFRRSIRYTYVEVISYFGIGDQVFIENVTYFTKSELESYESCVRHASQARDEGSSTFWAPGVEMIRVTSHGYLHSASLVVDVGGNVGFDADQFLRRYDPKIIVLEPLPSLYSRLVERFGKDSRVQLLNIGVGKEDREVHVEVKGHDGDATSIHTGKNVSGGEVVKIRKTMDVIASLNLTHKPIDLLHINCEGCEYDVMETVIQSGLVYQMRHIQWATHVEYGAVGNFKSRYCKIIEHLKRTHRPVYRFTFTWELWEMK